ncbi:MAG: hypothetical protein ACT4OV_07595 [Microthrixaceae bacterium]
MSEDRWMPGWLFAAVVSAVVAPLVVAVVVQRNLHWHPVFDLAMTELRVRDVGGRHTPLIGLQGRIGPTGSHPGPLSFYLLAPVYRVLGSSSFALQAATGAFHAAGAVTALWVARRRRDGRVLLGTGLVLLLLVQGYGLGPLTEPWNPHLPVLWFVAFLLSAWAVLEGDLPMLLVAVLAGSIGAQTHVPYLPVTVGIGGAVLVARGIVAWRRRGEAGPSLVRWAGLALLLGALLWTPPLIDEVVHDPGNLSQIADHLGNPAESPIGMRAAVRLMAERLDGWQLVVGETRHPGTYIRTLSGPGPTQARGAWTFGVWAACAVVAVALRHRGLIALHGLVAVSSIIGAVSISRIYGVPWHYLMLWGFGIGALMLLAIVGTLLALAMRWRPRLRAGALPGALHALGVLAVLAYSARLLLLAPDARPDTPEQTAQLGRLAAATVEALDAGAGAATGHAGRYFVYWDDSIYGGAEGIGLVNELVRRGFHVGVDARDAVKIAPYRVEDPAEATARVVLASGGWIDRWAAVAGSTRVAYDDPRTPEQRVEFRRELETATAMLRRDGRDDLVARLDTDLFNIALNEGVGVDVGLVLGRMIDLGVPVAVFVVPPGAAT